MKSESKAMPTIGVIEKILQEKYIQIQSLIEDDSDGVSMIDILDHIGTIENPNLLKKIALLQSVCSAPFHVSGKNFMHNHEYRDLLSSINYDEQKPWNNEKRKKKVHGIDDLGDTRPSTEYKSVCVPKTATKFYLNSKTIIGVVDKLHTRDEDDEIYGALSNKALCADIFNHKGNKIVLSFYVGKEDFGRVVSEELKIRKLAHKEKTNGYEKKGRDSVNLTVGMFLGCKSFKLFYFAESDIEIISEIQTQDSVELYNSISPLLGDKEKDLYNISNAKKTDKLIFTYANKEEKKIDIGNFTISEFSFSKMIENPTEQSLDLICGHYYLNKIICVTKIKNSEWVTLFNEQKAIYLEYQEMLVRGCTESEIEKHMNGDRARLQKSIIKSDIFRINPKDLKDFELIYINKDYMDNFVMKKTKNKNLNKEYEKIDAFKSLNV